MKWLNLSIIHLFIYSLFLVGCSKENNSPIENENTSTPVRSSGVKDIASKQKTTLKVKPISIKELAKIADKLKNKKRQLMLLEEQRNILKISLSMKTLQ